MKGTKVRFQNLIFRKYLIMILGVFIDVKSINIYHFRPFILQLCKYRHLELKDHDNLVGMFENSLLDGHLKTLENLYHEFVLTRGDFDERVFLNNKADERIGTPVKEKVIIGQLSNAHSKKVLIFS